MPLPLIGLLVGMPSWAKTALGVGVIGGILFGYHALKVRSLNKDILKLEDTLTNERLNHANVLISLQAEKANVEFLQNAVQKQNETIDNLQRRARVAEATASAKALEALRTGEAIAAALRDRGTPIDPGYDAVNQYLRERFPQ